MDTITPQDFMALCCKVLNAQLGNFVECLEHVTALRKQDPDNPALQEWRKLWLTTTANWDDDRWMEFIRLYIRELPSRRDFYGTDSLSFPKPIPATYIRRQIRIH